MDSKRLQKVARLIQKDLGEILQMEASNLFEGAMITVTGVRVSADLSLARVYVSIFAVRGKKVEEIFELLEQKKALVRMKLAQRVRHQLRVIPEIAFFIDDSLDYMENIDNLLKS
jgi:ribosome-binding factor A